LSDTQYYLEELIAANSTKLEDIEPGAEVNQNAFGWVYVDSSVNDVLPAESKSAGIGIIGGNGISTSMMNGFDGGIDVTITNTGVTGVKGKSETTYRTGNVNITPANIGLGNVNNTADGDKPVSTKQQ
jgi:hypothetical protein